MKMINENMMVKMGMKMNGKMNELNLVRGDCITLHPTYT